MERRKTALEEETEAVLRRAKSAALADPAGPSVGPAPDGLRKLAALIRDLPPPDVTYEDLYAVKEALRVR